MNRFLIVACVLFMSVGAAMGQTGKPSADVAAIPEAIRTLKWQDVDYAAASPLERCRALMFLNHALDELSAVATSQADLMSAYIDEQKLGEEFANFTPPPGKPRLSYADCQKIALALLRGPMADSPYATELSETDANGLHAYESLYKGTCQTRWNEFAQPREDAQLMGAFLKSKNRQRDFRAWAEVEANKRQQQYEQQMAAKNAAAGQKAADEAKATEERQRALAKEKQLQAQNMKLQQALTSAQQQSAQAQSSGNNNNNNNNDDDGWYSGWYYGAAANAHPWARDAANRPAAANNVNQRMNGWKGGAGGGAGRGGAGGGGRR